MRGGLFLSYCLAMLALFRGNPEAEFGVTDAYDGSISSVLHFSFI